MKTYAIASRIPIRYRRQMVAVKYEFANGVRCETGRCPLGWLFADGPRNQPIDHRIPLSYTVARRLRKIAPGLTRGIGLNQLAAEAAEFYEDWDNYRIGQKRLARAMGLK